MRSFLLVLALLAATTAQAQRSARAKRIAPQRAAPFSLSVEGGTDFPLSLGARGTLELPGRFQLSSGLGYLPRFYVETVNDALVSYGAYDRNTADVIEAALQNSLVWRSHLGWRPFENAGFYLAGGYTLITLGGGLTSGQVFSIFTGQPVPGEEAGPQVIDAHSTLHQLSAELGWTWPLLEHLQLRAALGGFYTFEATSDLRFTDSPALTTLGAPFLNAGENKLNNTYTTYVHGPVLTVTLGYVFF